MNVLLYIPSSLYSVDVNRQLVDFLAQSLGETAHVVHNGRWQKADNTIVHVFGCGDYKALRMIRKAARMGMPTLLSPIGSLQPWAFAGSVDKAFKEMAFQRSLVAASGAVHAWSKAEADVLKKLRWNENIVYIPNSVVTNSVAPDAMCARFKKLYQMVLDSSTYLLIDRDLKQLVYSLLQVGLDAGKVTDETFVAHTVELFAACSAADWRTIMIYAYEEGITDYIYTAVSRLHLTVSAIDVSEIARFDTVSDYADNEQPATPDDKAEEIFLAIRRLSDKASHNRASLAHYARVFILMRYSDYDEQQLVSLLRHRRLLRKAGRLMLSLHEITGLSEGFIPTELYRR